MVVWSQWAMARAADAAARLRSVRSEEEEEEEEEEGKGWRVLYATALRSDSVTLTLQLRMNFVVAENLIGEPVSDLHRSSGILIHNCKHLMRNSSN